MCLQIATPGTGNRFHNQSPACRRSAQLFYITSNNRIQKVGFHLLFSL